MLIPTVFILALAGLIDCRYVLDTKHSESSHMNSRHMHRGLQGVSVREPSRRTHAHLHKRQNNADRKADNPNNNSDANSTTLLANAIQTGSSKDGSVNGKQNPGQTASRTSTNNFINICSGKTLTNGLQVLAGSCNGIPMGDLPSKKNMVSSIITFPEAGDTSLVESTTFKIEVQMSNLAAGSFTNAAATYYAGPQFLEGGKVVGHTHVTVQDMGDSLNPTQALDPTQFVFFKGINDAGNGQGLLSATVTGGLKAGNYRVCTITSASNHQPVLMPVAQRGGQDDCTKFTVKPAGKNGGSVASSSKADLGSKSETKSTKANAVKSSSSAVSESKTESTSNSEATNAARTKTRKGGKGGNAGKATTKIFATAAPFQNSTIAQTTTTKAAGGNGGNGANGGKGGGKGDGKGNEGQGNGGKGIGNGIKENNNGKDTTKPGAVQASTTKSTTAPSAVAVETSQKVNNNNGKPTFTGKSNVGGGKQTTVVVVHKVVVIKTFFKFVFSLGGLPPAVGKQGNSFIVIGEFFDDFPSACAAACGHQWKKCISFSGPGFSFEECTSQRLKCRGEASNAAAPAIPVNVTATVTVPPTASVTGSVLSEVTLTTTVQSSSSQAPPILGGAEAIVTKAAESQCSVVTATVYIDAPKSTATPSSVASPIIVSKLFPNATIAVTSSKSSSSVTLPTGTAPGAALGGISAPEVTNSGDATRPFSAKGNTFVAKSAAVTRACDIQFNPCANAVNKGAQGFDLAACKKQQDTCVAAGV